MAEEGWEEKENCTKGAVEDFRLFPPPFPHRLYLQINMAGWINDREFLNVNSPL